MNEELQQALAALIEKSTAVAGDALAFTQEQLPEVIQQLLVWKAAESLISMSIALLMVALGFLLPWGRWGDKLEESESGMSAVLVLPWFVMLLIFFFSWDLSWLQIWLAPKVYLIEYAARLAN